MLLLLVLLPFFLCEVGPNSAGDGPAKGPESATAVFVAEETTACRA